MSRLSLDHATVSVAANPSSLVAGFMLQRCGSVLGTLSGVRLQVQLIGAADRVDVGLIHGSVC